MPGLAARRDPGGARATPLVAIIAYKSTKAAVQLALALLLAVWWPLGLPSELLELASWLHRHVTQRWAAQLAGWIVAGSSSGHILLIIAALALDSALTAIEAWALHTGRGWGAWLVAASTGSLLPFEMVEWLRVPRLSRALILLLNLAIFLYLAQRVWRERRHAQ